MDWFSWVNIVVDHFRSLWDSSREPNVDDLIQSPMDGPSSVHIVLGNSGSLPYPSWKTIRELREYMKGTSASLLVADLLLQAGGGLEDEVFAAFPRLAESDQRVMSRACEYLQAKLFNGVLNRFIGERSGLRQKQKLNFFRLAQRIRNEHGTARETSPPNCFQSFEDIVELERNIEINNCVEFLITCMRLDLVDGRHVDQMFQSTSTVEQLAAVYDEGVSMLERYRRYADEQEQSPRLNVNFSYYSLGEQFQFKFSELMRTRPCQRLWWRHFKMYLERATCLGMLYRFISDVDIPDADLDEALSCLLFHAELFGSYGAAGKLAHLLKSLLSRGASLFHRDQHGVSSLRRLLGLGYPHAKEWPLETLSTYICCPLKKRSGRIMADLHRLAPLSCLAARRIPPSTNEEQLPSQLRPLVEIHRELGSHWEREKLTGTIRSLEPVDGWRPRDDQCWRYD